MVNNFEKVVDMEIGDIYVWDYFVNEWVKEEIVICEFDVLFDLNNFELFV